jgi:hypothetical protein
VADLSGRPSGPPRWFLLAVAAAVLVGVLAAAWLFGAMSTPAPSPSPPPALSPAVPTETPGPCPAALLVGTLVFSELSGVAVDTDGGIVQVLWPAGSTVRREDDGRWVLNDQRGRPVARTGDLVEVGGGFVGPGERIWNGCGVVTVLPPP